MSLKWTILSVVGAEKDVEDKEGVGGLVPGEVGDERIVVVVAGGLVPGEAGDERIGASEGDLDPETGERIEEGESPVVDDEEGIREVGEVGPEIEEEEEEGIQKADDGVQGNEERDVVDE